MKKDSKITYDSVLYDVFNAIYYTPTEQEKQVINDIINVGKTDAIEKANTVCDYLGIERRGNRQAIYAVLNERH